MAPEEGKDDVTAVEAEQADVPPEPTSASRGADSPADSDNDLQEAAPEPHEPRSPVQGDDRDEGVAALPPTPVPRSASLSEARGEIVAVAMDASEASEDVPVPVTMAPRGEADATRAAPSPTPVGHAAPSRGREAPQAAPPVQAVSPPAVGLGQPPLAMRELQRLTVSRFVCASVCHCQHA